jgi:hypothetical protein
MLVSAQVDQACFNEGLRAPATADLHARAIPSNLRQAPKAL